MIQPLNHLNQQDAIPLVFIFSTFLVIVVQLVLIIMNNSKSSNGVIDPKCAQYFKYMIWNKVFIVMTGVMTQLIQRVYRMPIMNVSWLSWLFSVNAMLILVMYGLSLYIMVPANWTVQLAIFFGTYLYYIYYLYRSSQSWSDLFTVVSCMIALYAQTKVFLV